MIVTWDKSFATGITCIDDQHKELVALTNKLYQACLSGEKSVGPAFNEAMHSMVDYVRFHFTFELELLKRIQYPSYNDHKSEHDYLVKQILAAVEKYETGRKYVPHDFVRTLKDWVFSHIAITDKLYAAYVVGQLKKGLLSARDLEGR